MPDKRCEPPEGTPEGTVCVLERRRGETTAVITPTWMGDGWNVATGGDIIVSPAVLGARGWSFVRVAGDVPELSMIERLARAWIDDEGLDWDILPDGDKVKLCRHASAVLAELENPSEVMVAAGWKNVTRDLEDGSPQAIQTLFRAMIRAAKGEVSR